jgi:hypothetical protein
MSVKYLNETKPISIYSDEACKQYDEERHYSFLKSFEDGENLVLDMDFLTMEEKKYYLKMFREAKKDEIESYREWTSRTR